MKKIKFLLALVLLPLGICAQEIPVFDDLQLNDSVSGCKKILEGIAASVEMITPETVRFPLAEHREDHLVCKQLNTSYGMLESAVFTFGDNRLKYVEIRGNVEEVFMSSRKDTASYYMDYAVYPDAGLFVNTKEEVAWILTPEAIHLNLFTWNNPCLKDSPQEIEEVGNTGIPEFLTMGAPYEDLRSGMEAHSDFTVREELDGSDPNAQFQVNCFGVDYLGFPRKVEARFGDNKLNVVWILTGKQEEERVRKALQEQFGDPVYVSEAWEIYNNWQVGLRKDKPEVLLMEQEIGLAYKKSYFGQ
ncbi:hypothetical protein [Robertkochia flava]|uniref:hypothetical protein n=1 Tax=Robertkochia flava TaxID=3447986 RepID=UPI001CC929DA|nr:hypothetical protein [Robertkochia marina]